MIRTITYIETSNTIPYNNLAMEEYLLLHCQEDECILYLWQNRHTIVIGRNQNAWKECLVNKLEEEGGYLARRLSGGGAVYHDLGNLNFTFLVHKANYDVEKQLNVIIKAVKKLGIDAVKSGRNDILVNGKKFSGNAFYEKGVHCYHHGTLMVHVDMNMLSRYLTVSKEKLQSKGVNSVKSRVCNLSDFKPDLTIDELKNALKAAFEEEYGLPLRTISEEKIDAGELQKGRERFSSWQWLYGRKMDFQNELSHRFDWGEVVIRMQMQEGRIHDVQIYSDAMDAEMIVQLPRSIINCRYDKNSICQGVMSYDAQSDIQKAMLQDICSWIQEIEL